MKRGILAVMVSTVLFLVAAPAFAAGGYVGLEGGAVWLPDLKISGPGGSGELSTDTGYSIGAVGGYNFGTYRLEGEFSWRSNDNKEVSAFGLSAPAGGETTAWALMVNGYYDFRMVSPKVYPYLGAGIGGASVSENLEDPTVGGQKVIDDDDFVFAYQFIAGIAFDVSKEFTMALDYRYFATTDPSFEVIGTGGQKIDGEYSSHNVMLTLRYNF
ncbi:MAG TPA: outer membrane beta-barrel protein [Candidatus Deferrimicrobiaceae bacterium]